MSVLVYLLILCIGTSPRMSQRQIAPIVNTSKCSLRTKSRNTPLKSLSLKQSIKNLHLLLLRKVNVKYTKHKTVEVVFQEYMTSLIKAGRKSYALSIKQTYNSIKEFCHSLDFYFSEMDVAWLKRYELFLREQRLAENTIGIRFRTLRAIYNVAMEEDAVSQDCYPFKKSK